MAGIEDVLDLNEAAAIANVTPARLRQLIEAGQLRAKKVGNSWAVHTQDLNSLLGRGERSPGRPDDRSALARHLFIDLRSNSPVYLSLVDPLPEIVLGFRIDNRNSIELELDRLLVTATFMFPLAEGAVLDRFVLPPNKAVEGVQFRQYIARDRVSQLRQLLANETSGQSLHVSATGYFDTPYGTVVVYNHMIDRRRGEFPVNLPHKMP